MKQVNTVKLYRQVILPNMAENYIAENNLGGTREQQVAAAAKGLENLAARGEGICKACCIMLI